MLLITIEETVCVGIESLETYSEKSTKKHFLTSLSLIDFILVYKKDIEQEMHDTGHYVRFIILSVADVGHVGTKEIAELGRNTLDGPFLAFPFWTLLTKENEKKIAQG